MRRNIVFWFIASLALSIVLLSVGVFAQTTDWEEKGGVSGGITYCLSIGPTGNIYGCINDSIYMSTDKGTHWQDIAGNLMQGMFSSINCTPSNILFVTIMKRSDSTSGVYRSIDSGKNWVHVFGSDAFYNVQSSSDGNIYAVGIDSLSYDNVCLYSSSDAGSNWTRINGSIGITELDRYAALSISPKGHIFLNKKGGLFGSNAGFFRSTDQGTHWQQIKDVITSDTLYHISSTVTTIAFSKNGDCYTSFSYNNSGTPFRSTDDGLTWHQLDTNYFKVYDSDVRLMAINRQGEIFAFNGYRNICAKSNDNGNSWSAFDTIDATYPVAFASDSMGGLYIGSVINIYYVQAGFDKWQLANPSIGLVKNIIADHNGNLLATLWIREPVKDMQYAYETMFMVSGDYGDYWSFIPGESDMVPTVSSIITGITTDPEGNFIVMDDLAYGSSDGGFHWAKKYNTFYDREYTGITFSGTNEFYISHLRNGVLYFYNSGKSFKWITTGISVNSSEQFYAIQCLPTGYVFLGSSKAIYKLKDDDTLWTRSVLFPLNDSITSFYYSTQGKLYAGTKKQGILMSTDNGGSWNTISSGLNALCVNDIAEDDHQNLFAATPNGIFVLPSGQSEWQDISGNIGTRFVTSLCYVKSHGLFAGTRGRGIYFTKIQSNSVRNYSPDKGEELSVTYASDFSALNVTVTLSEASPLNVFMVDILGRTIKKFRIEDRGSGKNTFTIPLQGIERGAYFIRLSTDHSLLSKYILY